MSEKLHYKELARRLKLLAKKKDADIKNDPGFLALTDESPADIALAFEALPTEKATLLFSMLSQQKAAEVLAKLEPALSKKILTKLSARKTAVALNSLPPRDAATLVTEAPKRRIRQYLNDDLLKSAAAKDAKDRLYYPKGSAGRLMTTQFIRLHIGLSVTDAIAEVRKTDPDVDIPENLYIVKKDKTNGNHTHDHLLGVVSIRDLLMADPHDKVEKIMAKDVICIAADASEVDAAALMSKNKFMTLPVTDKHGYLTGVIPADDMIQVIVDRMRNRYSKAVGTDAEAMEHLSPFQAAKKRVPWLLGTMFIELMAGMVISHFDGVLKRVILLASFMPVISAISGNVGLQAAAITVRAVDSGTANRKDLWPSLRKEAATALLMASVCGFVLGIIGGIWSKHPPFGAVIGGALTCSMLTAGLMGTMIPVISKRFGFDPATTAGPFETAFQDVVGFGVFLWLATLLQQWIS
jgi:magnesium transporter